MDKTIYSTVELRKNFAEIINYATYSNEPILIKRRKAVLAAVISYELYEDLIKYRSSLTRHPQDDNGHGFEPWTPSLGSLP
jgi:hypothetical protein